MIARAGIIRVGSPLDYEKMNHYTLIVEALDTTTGNTAHVNVYINVTVSLLLNVVKELKAIGVGTRSRMSYWSNRYLIRRLYAIHLH